MEMHTIRRALHDIRHGRLNSGLARAVLGWYYREGHSYRVPIGPLRGMRLLYDRSINFHAMLGLWELETFDLLTKLLRASGSVGPQVVCDVGANIGVYTLFFARSLPECTVYAFEPAPEASQRLQENLSLNHIANAVWVPQACADALGEVDFYIGYHHHASSLHREWAAGRQAPTRAIKVPATTLDEFFYGSVQRDGPDFIKMDIEGGGTFALRGCDRCIEDKRPLFLIESHTPAEDRAISALILKHDYRAYRLDTHEWVSAPGEIYPIKQGIWGTLLLCPSEQQAAVQSQIG